MTPEQADKLYEIANNLTDVALTLKGFPTDGMSQKESDGLQVMAAELGYVALGIRNLCSLPSSQE